jgi:hypothetical protein
MACVACGAFGTEPAGPPPDAGDHDARAQDGGAGADGGAGNCGWEPFADTFDDRIDVIGPWQAGKCRGGRVVVGLGKAPAPRSSSLSLQADTTTGDARYWTLLHRPSATAGTTPSCLEVAFSIYVQALPTDRGIIVAALEFPGDTAISFAFDARGFEIAEESDTKLDTHAVRRRLDLPSVAGAWQDVRSAYAAAETPRVLHVSVGQESARVQLESAHQGTPEVHIGMMFVCVEQSTKYYLDDVTIR